MSSSPTHLPAPEGPGSVSGVPNPPAGFAETFTSRYVDTGELRRLPLVVKVGGHQPGLPRARPGARDATVAARTGPALPQAAQDGPT